MLKEIQRNDVVLDFTPASKIIDQVLIKAMLGENMLSNKKKMIIGLELIRQAMLADQAESTQCETTKDSKQVNETLTACAHDLLDVHKGYALYKIFTSDNNPFHQGTKKVAKNFLIDMENLVSGGFENYNTNLEQTIENTAKKINALDDSKTNLLAKRDSCNVSLNFDDFDMMSTVSNNNKKLKLDTSDDFLRLENLYSCTGSPTNKITQ